MRLNQMEANRRLAGLLGWTNVFDVGGALLGTPPAGARACRGQARVPDWAGDWRHCGPLLVEHLTSLRLGTAWMMAEVEQKFAVARQFGHGESDDQAARSVIVDAVIAKLEITQ